MIEYEFSEFISKMYTIGMTENQIYRAIKKYFIKAGYISGNDKKQNKQLRKEIADIA